jgi:hypothetical protein
MEISEEELEKKRKRDGTILNGNDQLYSGYKKSKPQHCKNMRDLNGNPIKNTATEHFERPDLIVRSKGKQMTTYEKVWPLFEEITHIDPFYRHEYLHIINRGGYVYKNESISQLVPIRSLKYNGSKKGWSRGKKKKFNALCTLCVLFLYKNRDLTNYKSLRLQVCNPLKITVNDKILKKVGEKLKQVKNAPYNPISQPGTTFSNKENSNLTTDKKKKKCPILRSPCVVSCPECESSYFEKDPIRAELTCKKCGLVIISPYPHYVDGIKLIFPQEECTNEDKMSESKVRNGQIAGDLLIKKENYAVEI